MSYKAQYALAWLLFAVTVAGGLVAAQATVFEFSPKVLAAITLVVSLAGAFQPFLPKIQRPPDDARKGLD